MNIAIDKPNGYASPTPRPARLTQRCHATARSESGAMPRREAHSPGVSFLRIQVKPRRTRAETQSRGEYNGFLFSAPPRLCARLFPIRCWPAHLHWAHWPEWRDTDHDWISIPAALRPWPPQVTTRRACGVDPGWVLTGLLARAIQRCDKQRGEFEVSGWNVSPSGQRVNQRNGFVIAGQRVFVTVWMLAHQE